MNQWISSTTLRIRGMDPEITPAYIQERFGYYNYGHPLPPALVAVLVKLSVDDINTLDSDFTYLVASYTQNRVPDSDWR